MPGPLIRPQRSPILDTLPEPVQKLLTTLFPPDDVMGPAMPQTAVVGGAARMASPALGRALEPLSRGSLDAGIDMAKSFLKDPLDWLPLPSMSSVSRGGKMDKPTGVLYSGLKDFADAAPITNETDALKIFAGERYYRRPTPPGKLHQKKDLFYVDGDHNRINAGIRASSEPFSRDPLVDELYNRYKTFREAQQRITNAPKNLSEHLRRPGNEPVRAKGLDDVQNIVRPGSTPNSERKPLSGRWGESSKKTRAQRQQLKKTYKKPVK